MDNLNVKKRKKHVRKLDLPDAVVTAVRMNYLASHGIRFQVRRSDGVLLHDLANCNVFGSCVLLSERAAAERAAAERIELSREELSLQKGLGGRLIG